MEIKLYNTLSRKKEKFKEIKKGHVGMYTCGPTVYWYQHIGNLRTAIFNDLLKRMLLFNKLKVNHVINITDVDDKTINGSKKEGISLKELTRKYEKIYLENLNELGIIKANNILRATENVGEMEKVISVLLKKKFAYEAKDGIYFSINKSKNYGKLAGLNKVRKTKSRVSADEYDKGNAQDFALWKFHTPEDGEVFWDGEIGKGRPGWHIECSVMSMKKLGKTLDIHTGGQDLIFPHHTNEIAQSESYTGKKFVNYWMHSGMLNMKDGKMSKSIGNILTLNEIVKQGYSPLHFRYLILQTHYRKPLDFSFESLDSSKNAFEKIKRRIIDLKGFKHKGIDFSNAYTKSFLKAINDDLNMPKALKVFWKVLDDKDFSSREKLKLLEKFDEILGLGIKEMKEEKIPKEIRDLVEKRNKLRDAKKWAEADIVRNRIRDKGYSVDDLEGKSVVRMN